MFNRPKELKSPKMKFAKVFALSSVLLAPGLALASDLYDPSIKHQPLDGIVKL